MFLCDHTHFSRIISVVLRHRTNPDKCIEQDIFNSERDRSWLTEKRKKRRKEEKNMSISGKEKLTDSNLTFACLYTLTHKIQGAKHIAF